MRTGLESLRLSPDPSPSVPNSEPSNGHFEKTVAIEGQPFQIELVYARQSGLRMTAFLSDGTGGPREIIGIAAATHEVVNTDVLRIVRIQRAKKHSRVDPRRELYSQLFKFAECGLRILPWSEGWDKMDPKTRRWLSHNQLPETNVTPSI
jgi:hypothetical protein